MLGVQAASEKADDSVRVFDADEMWWHAAMEAESHLGAQMPDTMYARENGPPRDPLVPSFVRQLILAPSQHGTGDERLSAFHLARKMSVPLIPSALTPLSLLTSFLGPAESGSI